VTTTPNPLRTLRLRRGWTQQDVAQNLDRIAWSQSGKHVGVNADMVAKWERGVKAPSRHYRELLGTLFDIDPAESGSSPESDDTSAFRHADPVSAVLAGTNLLLDRLGSDALVLRPRMLEAWRSEMLRRRSLLKVLTLAPAVGLTPGFQERTVRPSAEITTSLANLAIEYQQLYHVTAPTLLITPVIAHLETTRELLREGGMSGSLRRRLLANQAQVALLAGRVSFFDLNDAFTARGYYGIAVESSQESSANHLATASLGHIAFISAADGRSETALHYLGQAQAQLEKHPHPGLSSWLAAVASEITANARTYVDSLKFVERAQGALARPGFTPDLPWFDFFDESRLDGFAGYASLRAGRFDEAEGFLARTISRLPDQAVKQHAVVLADLATVHLSKGELDHACSIAAQAADRLRVAGYATGSDRLHTFRSRVAPWSSSAAVRALDQHLALTA